jgi:mRNA-degrading endonuclease RelE of RelBE toxin-antitoxin system
MAKFIPLKNSGMVLMSENSPPVKVLFGDEFKRRLKSLNKRYRKIRTDLQPLIEQLQAGETPGDRIVGTSYTVLKVPIKNSDNRKGKSGGYRVIYQVSSSVCFILLLIYSKSDQETVEVEEIQTAITQFLLNPEQDL